MRTEKPIIYAKEKLKFTVYFYLHSSHEDTSLQEKFAKSSKSNEVRRQTENITVTFFNHCAIFSFMCVTVRNNKNESHKF